MQIYTWYMYVWLPTFLSKIYAANSKLKVAWHCTCYFWSHELQNMSGLLIHTERYTYVWYTLSIIIWILEQVFWLSECNMNAYSLYRLVCFHLGSLSPCEMWGVCENQVQIYPTHICLYTMQCIIMIILCVYMIYGCYLRCSLHTSHFF